MSRKIQADIRIPIEKVEKRLSTALGKKDITFLEQQLTQQLKTMEFKELQETIIELRAELEKTHGR